MKLHILTIDFAIDLVISSPLVADTSRNVTYDGFMRNSLHVSLGIKYARDTSGQNRFKPPRPYQPAEGAVIDATSYGHNCPQPPHSVFPPLSSTNTSNISEDCPNLNIVRTNNTVTASGLPVLVWTHGGSFWFNSNREITNNSDGLILQSIENKTPIIHVALYYRLGVFGFAASEALKNEGSGNAGSRDHRLAIEWVRDNIGALGGDPERTTIHGQSSGGLAVGLQILAYGGSRPVPFQQVIFESQALEQAITGNVTTIMMQRLVDATGCNTTDLDSGDTICCLRQLDYGTISQASFDTYDPDEVGTNQGDCWMPVIDDDILPAPPSQLLAENRFANVTAMALWMGNDMQLYTPTDIGNMIALYPSADFQENFAANLSSQWYRSAQILGDLMMTCPPTHFGDNLARAGNVVYYISQNASLLPPMLAAAGEPGLQIIHTSEFPYTFGNLSHFDQSEFPFEPTAIDDRLEKGQAGSWAAFTYVGQPSSCTKKTLQGFGPAYSEGNQTTIFIAESNEALPNIDGEGASPALAFQQLRIRCGFFNSASIIQQLQY